MTGSRTVIITPEDSRYIYCHSDNRQTDRQTVRQEDRQTDRQTSKQEYRQTGRQASRQVERHTGR